MHDWFSYNSPIHQTIGKLQTTMAEEYDKQILRAVQQVGIEIDKEGLIAAINNDRRRYEAAYNRGYEDCRREYDDMLRQIMSPLEEHFRSFEKDEEEYNCEPPRDILKEFDSPTIPRNENTCVMCGADIPEGRQVCPQCEAKYNSSDI